MHTVPDYENAPTFDVYYNIPAYKDASEKRPLVQLGQGAFTRKITTSDVIGSPHTVERHAGAYVAWTVDDAIAAARAAGTIPGSATRTWATERPRESEPSAIDIDPPHEPKPSRRLRSYANHARRHAE